MEKKLRKTSLLCTTAVMACSVVLGAGLTAFPKTVSAEAENVSMTNLIGNKTDNVTVTAAKELDAFKATETKLTGLYVEVGKTETWSAELDATFTGKTTVEYFLNANSNVATATAFSVVNSVGETVATFVHMDKSNYCQWGNISSAGYVYNPANSTYTSASLKWNEPLGTHTYDEASSPTTLNYSSSEYGFSALSIAYAQHLSHMGTEWYNYSGDNAVVPLDGKYTETLTFDYDNATQKLQISAMSMKTEAEPENNTLASKKYGVNMLMGEVNVDLSDGYKIVMSSAPSITNPTTGVTYSYPQTANVLLTAVNNFDTTGATYSQTLKDETPAIWYKGESVVDGKNVITLPYGEKLNNFEVVQKATASEGDNMLSLQGFKASFAYADNKYFTAEEEITVTHDNLSKTYTVKVSKPTVNTADLFTKLTDGTQIRAAGTPVYNDHEFPSPYNWINNNAEGVNQNSKYDPLQGTALIIGGQTATNKQSGAKVNGILHGTTSLTYILRDTRAAIANAFVIQNAKGENVLHIVSFAGKDCWQDWNRGNAYLYDYSTKTYSTYDGDSYKSITQYSDANLIKPNYNSSWNNDSNYGTLTFVYNETDKNMTVQAIVPNGNTVTLGVVCADLTDGYTLAIETPNLLTEGYFADETNFDITNWGSYGVIVKKFNGIDVTGKTAEASSAVKGVVCDNGAQVAMGEKVSFTSNSVLNFGSLQYLPAGATTDVTVEEAIDVSNPGAQVAVVSDWWGTYEIPVTVKTLSDSLADLTMEEGAILRIGSLEDGSDKGLGFVMNISDGNMKLLNDYVGAGKAYTSVSYGMIIMPASYATDKGAVTVENLFGENAIYTWRDKESSKENQTPVLQMETSKLLNKFDFEHCVVGAITDIKVSNVTRKFLGVGYVKLTKADGSVEYKLVKSGHTASAFDTAKTAVEGNLVTNDAHKTWLIDNWLEPNNWTEPTGGTENE